MLIYLFVLNIIFSTNIHVISAQPYGIGVGINKQTPNLDGTFDIEKYINNSGQTDVTKPNGLLTPRLTGDQMEAMLGNLSTTNHGLLVYATQISTGTTPTITSTGFWMYDNAVANNWLPLEIQERAKTVTVRASGAADYNSLQTAFDTEAKKKYISNQNQPVEFRCEGNVGSLVADGSIPNIKITGISGQWGATLGTIKITNSIVTFDGWLKVVGNMDLIGSYARFSSTMENHNSASTASSRLTLKKTLVDIEADLKFTQMDLYQSLVNVTEPNTTITILPTSSLSGDNGGIKMSYSSFIAQPTTTLYITGTYTYGNIIFCEDASTMSIPGTIRTDAPCTGAIILARQASNLSVGNIIQEGTNYPRYVLYALTSAQIHHTGYIQASVGRTSDGLEPMGFNSVIGSQIFLRGTGPSVITNANSTPTSNGANAAGGDIKVSSDSSIYTFDNFDYTMKSLMGGQLFTQSKLIQGASTSNYSNIPQGNLYTSNGCAVF